MEKTKCEYIGDGCEHDIKNNNIVKSNAEFCILSDIKKYCTIYKQKTDEAQEPYRQNPRG